MSGSVLVALDGSAHSLCALPIARALGELEHATLHIVHVAAPGAAVAVPGAPAKVLLEELGLPEDALRGSVLDVRTGDAAAAIVRTARDAQSKHLVLCSYVGAPKPGTTLGHTALGVLRHAPCPVTLVRPERGIEGWRVRKILVPHDGTPTTTYPMRPAADLARLAGAEIVILHVASPGAPASHEPGALGAPRYVDQPQHEWPSWAREFIERVGSEVSLEGIRVAMALAGGEPACEILRHAREHEADLVVLAWHGDWEAGHAAIAKSVLRDAPCPVMVLRAD